MHCAIRECVKSDFMCRARRDKLASLCRLRQAATLLDPFFEGPV